MPVPVHARIAAPWMAAKGFNAQAHAERLNINTEAQRVGPSDYLARHGRVTANCTGTVQCLQMSVFEVMLTRTKNLFGGGPFTISATDTLHNLAIYTLDNFARCLEQEGVHELRNGGLCVAAAPSVRASVLRGHLEQDVRKPS